MIDLLQTSIDGDLKIVAGDLVLGESDTQNVFDLINSERGEFKQYPQVGLGIYGYLNSEMDQYALTQQISIQLNADGFNTSNMVVTFDNASSTEKIDVSKVKR